MTKVIPPASFSPELVSIMKAALDTAVHRIDRSHRTPATKAKMAQRTLRTASEGVADLNALMSVAVTRDANQRHDRAALHPSTVVLSMAHAAR